MRLTRPFLFALLSTGLAGCDLFSPDKGGVASIQFKAARPTIEVGFTEQFVVRVLDKKNAPIANKPVTWNSSAPSVLTVSDSGVVTALTIGSAVITATVDGKSADTTITAYAALARDVVVVDAQWTQAIQDSAGTIPMVVGGLPAVVNVLVQCNPGCLGRVPVVLRRTAAGVTHVDTAYAPFQLTSAPTLAEPSVQFVVPAAALAGAPTWQVEVDPLHRLTGDSLPNNVFPRGSATPLNVTTVPTLKLKLIPVALAHHGGFAAAVSSAVFPDYLRSIQSKLPVGAVSISIGPSLSSSADFGIPPSGGASTFWGQVLQDVDAARLASADPNEYWMAVIQPPAGFTNSALGGIAYLPPSGTANGGGTRSSVVMQYGWFNNKEHSHDIFAHELGHNFSRRHAPCGSPSNPDPVYPSPDGSIGLLGHNVFSMANGETPTAVAVAATVADVMSYCSPTWISDFNYRAIISFRGPGAIALKSADTARQNVLLLRGTVDATDAVTIDPVLSMIGRVSLPPRGGRFRVRGLDATGVELFSHSFDPDAVDHSTARTFLFAIPDDGSVNQRLDRVEILGPVRTTSMRRSVAAVSDGDTLALRDAGAGMTEARCRSASRAVLIQDERTGDVLGIGTGPSARFRMQRNSRIAISCSDGARNTRRIY